MINKALQSYATIQTLWTNSGMDLIEIYAVLSIKALDDALNNGEHSIDEKKLRDYFVNEYGLTNITVGAAAKFLKRLENKHNVVYRHNHAYVIKPENLNKFRKEYPYEEDLSGEIEDIAEEIRQFAQEVHNMPLTKEQVLEGLINFFERYGGDIVIEQKDIKDFAVIKYKMKTTSQKIRYVISEYIVRKEEEDSDRFNVILQFAVGNMVASAVSMQDFTERNASLKDLVIYLDAPVIFNILKLSGDVPYELSKDLIERLRKLNCRLVIGSSHYSEIVGSINYAIGLLKEEHPDLTKANRIYFNAIERGLSDKDLEAILQSVDDTVQQHGIETLSLPIKEAGFSDIKEGNLRKIIIDAYSDNGKIPVPQYRKQSISRDAKVIYHVLMLRSGRMGLKLNDAGAMLVSNNMMLCNAVYLALQGKSSSRFPPVILTENLSTIIWANSSERNVDLHKKQLINECLSSLRVRADMLRRFYKDIKSKHAKHAISDQAYLDVITSDLTQQMFAEQTFNDHSMYTDEVAMDIVRRVNEIERMKAQEDVEKSRQEESESSQRLDGINSSFMGKSISYANRITNLAGIALGILLICNSYGLFKHLSGFFLIAEVVIFVLFAGWAAWNWLGWIPSHKKVWIWLAEGKYQRYNRQFGQAIKDDAYPDFNILYATRNQKAKKRGGNLS